MDAILASLPASPAIMVAIGVVTYFASIVQFGLGMGFGLVAAPLLALLDPEIVPAPALFIGMALSVLGAWHERDAIRWSEVRLAIVGRAAGVVVALGLLVFVTRGDGFLLLFGSMIAIAVLLSVSGWRMSFAPASLFAMAVLSGTMGTITSVGAPPMAIVYSDRVAAKARPTLAAFFAFGCALSLIGLYGSGMAGRSDLYLTLFMLPAMFAGALTSVALRGKFDRRYRFLLLSVSGIAALFLIARGLW